MVQSVIQHSFHAGEWAPDLNARVDLAKYKSAAALLENYFVDYRGGASSRPGTKYILQTLGGNDDGIVRLIPFQSSPDVGYILEFGHQYIRFFFNGSPIFNDGDTITNVTGATITASSTAPDPGTWIFVNNVVGVTGINGRYWIVASAAGSNLTVTDLLGNTPSFSGYVSGGSFGTVMVVGTPYADTDLALIKFTQLVDRMFLCHPNYPPAVLTLIDSANWTYNTIPFGSGVSIPVGLAATSTNAGAGNHGYVVTAVDSNGQESGPTAPAYQSLNIVAGQVATIHLTWTAVSGAKSYNVYRTPISMGATPPAGSALGFLMNVTQPAADDSFTSGSPYNATDFSVGPPLPQNPFQGAGVDSITVTNAGTYTNVPSAVIDPAPSGGSTATCQPVLSIIATGAIGGGGTGFAVGEQFSAHPSGTGVLTVEATAVDGFGHVTAVKVIAPGSMSSPGAATPANPVTMNKSGGPGSGGFITVVLTWGVTSVTVVGIGSGYTSVPAITFSSGAATATVNLQTTTAGNPSVPGLHEQRLVLAARPLAVQTFNMSQPGSYYNFDISNPIQPSDAIEASIVSGQLNEIKSMASVPTGLILLTSKSNWLVSSSGGALSPIDIIAHAHSFNGASDVPPIIANFDILFVQNKNSIVRDLTFNFYTQIYTGTDISVLSSHLFYGFQILEWAWAEEPFKIVWAVRDDGIALSLTFLKEQELIGWSHSNTVGLFKSVAVITEAEELFNSTGLADATYFVIQRDIDGHTVKYIERLNSRLFTEVDFAWTVDAGLRYIGAPTTTFSGGEHLAGQTVTGLADGVPITPFVMPNSGIFTLPNAASTVVVGLPFTPKLQTLPLDIGEPTVQGKRKGINGVTVRVKDTLGLTIGKNFNGAQVPMKDLIRGNVGSASNVVVNGLVTGDARTIIDPSWDVPGQYCIAQPYPYPTTILGVIPEIAIGDTK